MADEREEAAPLVLDAGQLARTFPFHLVFDAGLRVQALGPSLRKLLPALQPGEPIGDHFSVSLPEQAGTFEQWCEGVGELVILKSRRHPDLVLRGAVERHGPQRLILLLTAVVGSFEEMRQFGLGLRDFALHDSVAETIRASHTQLVAAQEADFKIARLIARSEELRAMLELGDNGILYAGPDGRVTHVNRPLQQMFGIDESRVAHMTLDDFERHLMEMLAPEEAARHPVSALLGDLEEAVGRDGFGRHTHRIRLVSPRRLTLQMSAGITATRDIVLYFRDITSETEVDRMKSEFLSTAAHELRTPLASIFGFAELMISRPMSPERQQELLGTIHRQSQLLINLINELLDLSRIEARQGKDFHRQYHRVETLIHQTIKGLLVRQDKRQVKLYLPHGAECIMVDPEKTMQALLNVLTNAFKYSPEGGDITIETRLKDEADVHYVGIRVTDHGMGMTPEQLARVFERFWRADPSGAIPGTGLGMSLVKEITELQEGHVEVISVPQQGTTVTLWFPLVPDFVLSRPSDI